LKKIDFEAHFYTQDYVKALYNNDGYPNFRDQKDTGKRRLWYFADVGQPFADGLLNALLDVSDQRIARMDAYAIDIQVLSLSAPGIEQLDTRVGTELSRKANNFLSEMISKNSDRFMGFAALAPNDPQAAAGELERAVRQLGFIGWNTHSNFGNTYLDEKKYWPILETAAKLRVPVYLHPTVPAIPSARNYGFVLAGAPFGFGFETALCMMRLIYSGVFDRYPDLKIILGHLGDKRIDWAWVRPFDPEARPQLAKRPSEYLNDHVYVTTSGNYYEPAFLCTRAAMGIDRILLGTDYPYEDAAECMQFIEKLPITKSEIEKIYFANAAQMGIGLQPFH